MQARSVISRKPDGYRAGLELGAALADLEPEIVFLFTTVHFVDNDDLLSGLYEGLGRDDVLVIGCCGDGCFESRSFTELGASALGLCSDGELQWRVGRGDGVGADPVDATRRAFAGAMAQLNGQRPALCYLLSDFRTDATQIERVVEREIDVPVVGGLAMDNARLERCALYLNRARLEDCVLVLAIAGPLRFAIHTGNRIPAVGMRGRVEQAEGATLQRIEGISARAFMERETGQAVLRSDPGTMPLTISDPEDPEIRRVRSVIGGFGRTSPDDGSLTLYGGIDVGAWVQPCVAAPQDLLGEVDRIAGHAAGSGFSPTAALVTSCAGRKLVLGEDTFREVEILNDAFARALPLAGFPSGGEFGPMRTSHGYSRNLFHNMSFVLVLMG